MTTTIIDRLELSQRVGLYYFVFGLIGVIAFSAGIAYATQRYLSHRSESKGLAMIGQAAPRVLIKFIQDDDDSLDKLLQDLHREHRLIFASIVDSGGVITFHTDPSRCGKSARSHPGNVTSWGKTRVHRYVDESQIPVCEFRTPLVSGDRDFGTLRMAELEPSIWSSLTASYEYLLFALLAAMIILGIGMVVVRKTLTSATAIEHQLRRIGAGHPFDELSFIDECGDVPTGWNRLVEAVDSQADVTDEKVQDAVANFRRNQVFKILDSLPDAIAVTDPSGTIRIANQSFTSLFTDSREGASVSGRRIFDYLTPEASGSPAGDQDEHHLSRVEEIVLHVGDEERILRVAKYPLGTTRNGGSANHVWTIRDITQLKLTEKMRDEFLDSATHELRTPLSNIKAYAETLAITEELDVEQQKEFCNTINSEATRLARFIDDLLSISSVEAGSLSVSRENVEVDRMLRDVLTKVKPLMAQKNIEFNVKLPQKSLPEIHIDKDKIQVALVNILGNAAKYTPENGRVDVHVKFADDQICVSIEDNGIGVSEAELPKLFDKFYRSENYQVQKETGTGLGLSLAREIVQLHGGKILVESELGKGSKFTVMLPVPVGVLA